VTAPPTLQIIIASTRPGRKGPAVATWFEQQARQRGTFNVDVADLASINLPMMDEPEHPRLRRYQHDHTKRWSARIDGAHAFVFVTPEYNHSAPPALVNALDRLSEEWAYKPVAFVSYGGVSAGPRGVQTTKLIAASLRMVPLVEIVAISTFTKFIDATTGAFTPEESHAKSAATMLDELLRWSNALSVLRTPAPR
jgi:NAD(P)H-dependent FMN reductase